MVACEMPLAAASFLKAASQGSKGAVLRQFAWPNAAVGTATNSAASAAQICRIACIVTVRVGSAMLCGRAARFPTPSFGRVLLARAQGASCSCNGNSPILFEGSPERLDLSMNYRRVVQRRTIFDNIMTPRCQVETGPCDLMS